MEKLSMKVVNPRAAGIDIGSRFHMVAVDQQKENVRRFGIYTSDHYELIKWLEDHQITTIAMESTGSYWQTLFDALQQSGFDVILVSGNQTKNLKGKKTDMLDCLWIQKLHSLGLLSGSFLPGVDLQMLRTYYNHRQHLIKQMSKYINKMQKALRLMNIRLDIALNDIMGKSGRAIIEAILSGERNPEFLAKLANYRVKKSKDEIALSLEGNWRSDLLFEVKSCLTLHDFHYQELLKCDHELESKLQTLQKKIVIGQNDEVTVKTLSKYTPGFEMNKISMEYFGVDIMQIPGVSYNTILCLLTQVGNDIFKFPSSKHFCSWLRLAPNNKITGGKVVNSRTPKGKNQLAIALRQAANSIGNQKQGELNQFFKRIAFKKGRAAAVTSTARKIAIIIYQMVKNQEAYKPHQSVKLSNRIKNKIIKNIKSSIDRLELTEDQIKFMFLSSSLSDT